MDANNYNGDIDPREFGPDPDSPDRHEPEYPCDCHCPVCHGPLSQVTGMLYAACGDCEGGRESDGEDFRGDQAAAFDREQQDANRVLK
jgi:hypothetical protein